MRWLDGTASVLLLLGILLCQARHDHGGARDPARMTRWTIVGKVMSLLFNVLPRLVITFLPRSKGLLISWLWSQSAVILEPPNNKVCHYFHCFPIYLP